MNKKSIIKRLLKLVNVANTQDGKETIDHDLDDKIKKVKGSKGFLQQVKKLYAYFKDPKTSKGKKALIGAALLYFIIPTDVVNDLIPIVGYIDDGVAIAYVWSLINKELTEYNEDPTVIDIEAKIKDE